MVRIDLPDGGYTLAASPGLDLAVLAEDGTEQGRTKEVTIPAAGTLNAWREVPEITNPAPTEEDAKAARIAALEAELAALKEGTA